MQPSTILFKTDGSWGSLVITEKVRASLLSTTTSDGSLHVAVQSQNTHFT